MRKQPVHSRSSRCRIKEEGDEDQGAVPDGDGWPWCRGRGCLALISPLILRQGRRARTATDAAGDDAAGCTCLSQNLVRR